MIATRERSSIPTKPPPFQFSLRAILFLTAWVAVGLALIKSFGGIGFFLFVVAVVTALIIKGSTSPRRTVRNIALTFGGFGLLAALFLPAFPRPRTPSRRATCANNLKQIGLALHSYHSVHGTFPPAYIADENGTPMHSWRVPILPYLEAQSLYSRYRFDEPWDGPNNRKLHGVIVSLFSCPSDRKKRTDTSYVAVVGPQTAWPGEKSTTLDDFQDEVSTTILLVEVAGSGIHWMEPRDLHVTQMAPTVNPAAGQGISSGHPEIANIAFADAAVRVVWKETDPERLRALLTIAGGEKIEDED